MLCVIAVVLFVMFVSIVIGNLLVALTVSEIGVLTKEGEEEGLKRITREKKKEKLVKEKSFCSFR